MIKHELKVIINQVTKAAKQKREKKF